jgi:hypothetical protein
MRVLSLLLVIASIFSVAASTPSRITKVTLERTSCFGTCPVYKVEVRSDGVVNYAGEAFVKDVGKRSRNISASAFQRIVAKIQQVHFFDLDDEYLTKRNPNGSLTAVTDLPTTITTVTTDKLQKSVRNYYGGPNSLKELEDLIDEVCGTAAWIGKGKT